jgi:hypothetical protein
MFTRSNLALFTVHFYIIAFMSVVYFNLSGLVQTGMYFLFPVVALFFFYNFIRETNSKGQLGLSGKK